MKFSPHFQPATFLRRYKRFLADIRLPNGDEVTVHCPNTGAMKHCMVAGSPCWYSASDNPKRKYPYTWEIASTPGGHLAGIHSRRANHLVLEGIERGVIKELQGYGCIDSEVTYGKENSRIDFLLSQPIQQVLAESGGYTSGQCYVEVKSVTLCIGDGIGCFPDSVSQRGSKHLRELMQMVDLGHRAVLLFCVQHTGIQSVTPADTIDPVYGATLRDAVSRGVEVLAYAVSISEKEIVLTKAVNVGLEQS